ncbi:MAG TPA: bacterial transcriptional activator domain-containing protein [Jatrophihabitans sp.]|nr:bacterial transcriptional activator domain-containing protein [Jatrophihabitans sp.]
MTVVQIPAWGQEWPACSDAPVSARFLGPFSLTVQGREIERWRAGKARSFFQYLTLHRGQLITRDRLHSVLWPEAEWGPCSSSLKVACHAARAAVGAARTSSEPSESGIRLIHRNSGYLLQFQNLWCDLDEFQALVRSGLRHWAAGDRLPAVADLDAAMSLYGGDFLSGQDCDWVVEYREHFKSLAIRALDVLRADAVACGDSSEIVAISQRTLHIDPHHEPTYQALIREHGRLGEPERARSWFHICARRLDRDLGVDPALETKRALHTAVAAGRESHGVRGPAPARADRAQVRPLPARPSSADERYLPPANYPRPASSW